MECKSLNTYLFYSKRLRECGSTKITCTMDQNLKKELVLFVLSRAPVWLFNESIKEFSVQRLYSRYKRELIGEYFSGSVLNYAISMAEVFREYQCDEIECPALKFKIDSLRNLLSTYKRYSPNTYLQKVEEHNIMVEQYSKLLAPQNKLIRLYKKVRRDAAKQSV